MITYEFKTATVADARVIADLDYEIFPENNFSEETLGRTIEAGGCHLINLVGEPASYMLSSEPTADLVDILRLGVLEPQRGKGLGTVLLDNVIRLEKDTMLTVRKWNTPALNLYLKHQFEIV